MVCILLLQVYLLSSNLAVNTFALGNHHITQLKCLSFKKNLFKLMEQLVDWREVTNIQSDCSYSQTLSFNFLRHRRKKSQLKQIVMLKHKFLYWVSYLLKWNRTKLLKNDAFSYLIYFMLTIYIRRDSLVCLLAPCSSFLPEPWHEAFPWVWVVPSHKSQIPVVSLSLATACFLHRWSM